MDLKEQNGNYLTLLETEDIALDQKIAFTISVSIDLLLRWVS